MSITDNAAKTCTKCNIGKSLSVFGKDKQKKDGLTSCCQKCRAEDHKVYYHENKEHVDSRNTKKYHKIKYTDEFKTKRYAAHIKRNYGITISDYNDMYIEQGGRCAICGRHQTEFSRRLLVDHCHETEILRGLLCYNCNTGLGQFGDKLQLIKNAVKYLEIKP